MKKLIVIVGLAILSSTFFSCSKDKTLDRALRLAGENRIELEQVLRHYAADPADRQKLAAAKFLIRNMPGHGTYSDAITAHYYEAVLATYPNLHPHTLHTLLCLPDFYNTYLAERTEDIQNISAEFLIWHIDRVFALWHATPWHEDIPFEIFCEHLLPYRAGSEPLDYLMHRPDVNIDSMLTIWRNYNTEIPSFRAYAAALAFPVRERSYNLPAPVGNHVYNFDCISNAVQYMLLNRLIGVPAAIDYTPDWPHRNGRHYWDYAFDPVRPETVSLHGDFRKFAKIYRTTYSHNPMPRYNGRDYIPGLFQRPFNRDVTDLYVSTEDVVVRMDGRLRHHKPDHIYLCIFNELVWRPVAWAEVRGRMARFEKVGTGIAYLPVFFNGKEMMPAGYPFILHYDGTVQELKPDADDSTTLRLRRKHTMHAQQLAWDSSIAGMMVKGVDTAEDETLLHTFTLDSSAPYYSVAFEQPQEFRLWKFEMPPRTHPADVAELCLYDASGAIISFDGAQFVHNGRDERPHNLIDGDVLTYGMIRNNLIIDFGAPVEVSRIDVMARNDDNYIVPGQIYELFYMDRDKWVSLGIQVADERFLEFDDVPQGALYWLRNRSKGREERIFTASRDGEIKFW
ncbi:MAG: hypothetical protein FWE10_05635 [Rikenellaceae bacterium]|nr:hypothetical protein [Rikenellaceae bacterium]MCL2693211.1 hypothetical protein [Rikenellaceae bacterium]